MSSPLGKEILGPHKKKIGKTVKNYSPSANK
jgi:hypothetical protein